MGILPHAVLLILLKSGKYQLYLSGAAARSAIDVILHDYPQSDVGIYIKHILYIRGMVQSLLPERRAGCVITYIYRHVKLLFQRLAELQDARFGPSPHRIRIVNGPRDIIYDARYTYAYILYQAFGDLALLYSLFDDLYYMRVRSSTFAIGRGAYALDTTFTCRSATTAFMLSGPTSIPTI